MPEPSHSEEISKRRAQIHSELVRANRAAVGIFIAVVLLALAIVFAAHVPIIMISGSLNVRAQLTALQGPHRAHYILEKPVDLDELDSTVERALNDCGLGEMVRMLKSLESLEKIDANEPERRFTERIARQHAIAQRLGLSGETPNVSRLAEEFKVDRKTIRTDLNDLRQRGQIDPRLYPGAAHEEP